MIAINENLSIPASELHFTASRSAGPGGQHVNKVSSRVTLHFSVVDSPSLTETQKRRITVKLRTRVNREGVLKLHCQRHRSQVANRRVLLERFADLVRGALKREKVRKATRPSEAAKERRLKEKKRRAQLKQRRSRRLDPDD